MNDGLVIFLILDKVSRVFTVVISIIDPRNYGNECRLEENNNNEKNYMKRWDPLTRDFFQQ